MSNDRRIRTWRCGEVGVEGTRLVLEDGKFVVGGSRGSKTSRRVYQSDLLIPFVGIVIRFHDWDDPSGRLTCYVAKWINTGGALRSTTGEFICYANEIAE